MALTAEGGVIGPFPGESSIPGRENTIDILGYADSSTTPFSSAAPAGLPSCGPLVVRKRVDGTSP